MRAPFTVSAGGSDRTFVKVNCAAIPAGLIESELFGHEKGAFTGAIARKMGRLELAHEGTLFLDEVGELPLDLQPKLASRASGKRDRAPWRQPPISVNVRLIAATNRDLAQMVAEKQFRSDLFYRLKVFPIFCSAAPRPRGRHPGAGPSFRIDAQPPHGQEYRDHSRGDDAGSVPLAVARQHSRTRKLSGACRDPDPRLRSVCAAR